MSIPLKKSSFWQLFISTKFVCAHFSDCPFLWPMFFLPFINDSNLHTNQWHTARRNSSNQHFTLQFRSYASIVCGVAMQKIEQWSQQLRYWPHIFNILWLLRAGTLLSIKIMFLANAWFNSQAADTLLWRKSERHICVTTFQRLPWPLPKRSWSSLQALRHKYNENYKCCVIRGHLVSKHCAILEIIFWIQFFKPLLMQKCSEWPVHLGPRIFI